MADPYDLDDALDAALDDALAGVDVPLPPDEGGLQARLAQVFSNFGRTTAGDDGVNLLELWAWITGTSAVPTLAAQFWTGLDEALGAGWPGAEIGFEVTFARALEAADGDVLRALLALMDACRPATRQGRPARALAFMDLGADPAGTLGWAALAWLRQVKGPQALADDALTADPAHVGAASPATALAAVLMSVGGTGQKGALEAVEAFTEAKLRALSDPAGRGRAIDEKLAVLANPPVPPTSAAVERGLTLAQALAAAR